MGQNSRKLYIVLICLVLTATILAVFGQLRHHEFIDFDDNLYIFDNDHVKAGLETEGLVWAFTDTHAYNWHPLTSISHMLDCEIYGLYAGGHLFTNLLFHIANTICLLLVFNYMTRNIWASAFVAAAFALHPLHVESVAWASERKDVLSTLLWILAMAAYVRYTKRPGVGRYLAVLLVFALGLTAKQMLVTLPFVLLLLDYWPLGRMTYKGKNLYTPDRGVGSVSVGRCILEKLPFLFLSVGASVVVFMVQRASEIMRTTLECPLVWRIGNALVSYMTYIAKMLWPTDLAIFYPHQKEDLPIWLIACSALVLAGITVAVLWKIRSRPYLAVGWFWYVGTLVPVIGLVQVGLQAYADRYTYIPLTGIFVIVAWGLPDLFGRLRHRKALLSILAISSLLALGIGTWKQAGYWRDSTTLYKHATEAVKNNWWASNNLGALFAKRGELDEALNYFNETLHDKPNAINIHHNIALVLRKKGRIKEALEHFSEELRLNPKNPVVYYDMGKTHSQAGQFDKAIVKYNQALELDPDFPEVHNNLGIALDHQGRFDEAIIHFNEALRIRPDWFKAYYNLGTTLMNKGNINEAINQWKRTIELKPDHFNAHFNLGNAYSHLKKHDLAVPHWIKVVELKPDQVDTLNYLAWMLATIGDDKIHNPAEALEYAQKACELTGYNRPDCLDSLAAAYAATGNFTEAIATAEKALKLALSSQQKALAEQIRYRLLLYNQSKSYREPLQGR